MKFGHKYLFFQLCNNSRIISSSMYIFCTLCRSGARSLGPLSTPLFRYRRHFYWPQTTCRVKMTLSFVRSLEREMSTINTSQPVFTDSSVALRAAGIHTFSKLAAEDDKNVTKKKGSFRPEIIVALMGPHYFSKFRERVKRCTSVMIHVTFFILKAARCQNAECISSSWMFTNGHTAEELVREASFFWNNLVGFLEEVLCCVLKVPSKTHLCGQKFDNISQNCLKIRD